MGCRKQLGSMRKKEKEGQGFDGVTFGLRRGGTALCIIAGCVAEAFGAEPSILGAGLPAVEGVSGAPGTLGGGFNTTGGDLSKHCSLSDTEVHEM